MAKVGDLRSFGRYFVRARCPQHYRVRVCDGVFASRSGIDLRPRRRQSCGECRFPELETGPSRDPGWNVALLATVAHVRDPNMPVIFKATLKK